MSDRVILSPKYRGDRITLSVDFSQYLNGSTLSSVEVTVSVHSGEDPLPSDILVGVPFVSGTYAKQMITLGLVGVIYSILFRGTLANGDVVDVEALQAIIPVDGDAAPDYVIIYGTTPPYPILVGDTLTVAESPLTGFIYQMPHDNIEVGFVPLTGTISDLIVKLFTEPDTFSVGIIPQSGTIETIIVRLYTESDDYTVSFSPMDGSIVDIILRYLNYDPDKLTVAFTPLTGTIT